MANDWQAMDTAPKDGHLVFLKNEHHPEWGEHLMSWSKRRNLWEGLAFPILGGPRIVFWDATAEQPTHWKHAETPT